MRTFEEFLEGHLGQEMLRFTTAGSVDDGKSTLIGRLLHDTKSVYEDQLAAVKKSRVNRAANGHVDFSLLTDGLKAEREQGITIDVAYRYFSTARRKFIIADTPGHEQYTRNMATGASTADVAIISDRCAGVCQGGRAAAAVAQAYLHRVAAGDSACGGGGEQDGPGGLLAGELRGDPAGVRCAMGRHSSRRTAAPTHSRRCRPCRARSRMAGRPASRSPAARGSVCACPWSA